MRYKRFKFGKFAAALLFVALSLSVNPATAEDGAKLPPPQLVTNAWMFIIGFEADPEAIKALLPEGLEPGPSNRVVLNMYTVPDGKETSGFGAYTLTYVTLEVAGQDSYTMGQPTGFPGRYFTYYFNSSPLMREFAKPAGIPAEPGFTTTTVKDGKLTAVLEVDGVKFIESTADVGSDFTATLGGHLNYFGLIKSPGMQQVVKYPIPWIGHTVKTENATVNFTMPEDHPLYKLKPKKVDWAVWVKGSFVYPQYQVIHETKTAEK